MTFTEFETNAGVGRIWLVETPAPRAYARAEFADGDCLLFGAESKGLPPGVRERYAATHVGIPMPGGKVRSINLATAVGVVLYEALRQLHDW
jgi:tRNA (cytidine/uridine-2'-O-)-methyltransferase